MSKTTCTMPECTEWSRAKGLCANHYSSARWRASYVPHAGICKYCQAPFTARDKRRLHCYGEPCAKAHKRDKQDSKTAQCSLCDKPVRARGLCHTHWRKKYRKSRAKEKAPRLCAICGTTFNSWHPGATICSDECRDQRLKERRDTRRALERDAFVARVYRKKVFEADGYRCHICHKMTKRTEVVPHPLAPTLDHVTPLSLGGKHEPSNCRTAHFLCNSKKGHRGAGDQMLLFAL